MSACYLAHGHSFYGLRKSLLEINQISWIPPHFRATLQNPAASFQTKPNATLLTSRIFILLFSTPIFFRGLNSDHLMASATKAAIVTSQTSFYLFLRSKSGRMIHLTVSHTTYIKNLSPTHSRNLLDCLCSVELPWVIEVYLQTIIFNSHLFTDSQ